jgi:hypothetical protein
MKLHLLSDLHIEFSGYQPNPVSRGADVIVLAGDIWKKANGIPWARKQWPDKEIIYVAGNHEFYGSRRKDVISQLRMAALQEGVHFLENEEVQIDGVRFLGCTLWTDFELFGVEEKPWCMHAGQQGLNDFRVIHEGDAHFSPMDSVHLHCESVAWLERKLECEKFDGKTVVVRHHLPSMQSVSERFAKDELSACFASHLDHLLGYSELWVHGHSHDSFDYLANRTRVICNPRGYVLYNGGAENDQFRPDLIIEI